MNYRETIGDINSALLDELNRLSEIKVGASSATELQMEIERSKAIEGTARVAIENVAAAVATEKAMSAIGSANAAPKLLEG